ncbi:MAG: helix-turn-helix transcriptional regulator [Thermoanaerobaculia bacterium]
MRRSLAAQHDQTGWLAARRDPVVGRALVLLPNDPARAWTLKTLAREAGISRTLLAERFQSMTGQPPMQYLKHWRMQIAAGLLTGGDVKVAHVAMQVGHELLHKPGLHLPRCDAFSSSHARGCSFSSG